MAETKITKILHTNDYGQIFRVNKIPNTMFNFYVLSRQEYKDGTHRWNLCVEHETTRNYIVLDSMRGTKEEAVAALLAIIGQSSQAC